VRALHEARLLGAVAELEALYAAVQHAAGGDDPERGRRELEAMVQARGGISVVSATESAG
jgi:hypothetical protein